MFEWHACVFETGQHGFCANAGDIQLRCWDGGEEDGWCAIAILVFRAHVIKSRLYVGYDDIDGAKLKAVLLAGDMLHSMSVFCKDNNKHLV